MRFHFTCPLTPMGVVMGQGFVKVTIKVELSAYESIS